MVISEMLKEVRENAGLTQEQFAEKLDISRQAVSKWERGLAMPDIENLMYISNIFNVSLDTIIKGDKKMENKVISDSKNAKLISRLFLIGFFAVIILVTIFTTEPQPIWKWGLIIGLILALFVARVLIKKYTKKVY
jgi:transcriptional regulator with XRE-family HTH domain